MCNQNVIRDLVWQNLMFIFEMTKLLNHLSGVLYDVLPTGQARELGAVVSVRWTNFERIAAVLQIFVDGTKKNHWQST